ncbi:MAG: hypothetical protein ACRCR9_00165, partial [Chitinophagaceae bacterium]
ENWGQLSTEYGDMPPVKFPCALIDIKAVEWQNVAHPHQQGTATLTLLIADLRLTNSSMNAPKSQQDNAYKIHTLLHEVHHSLQGFMPTEYTSQLSRTYTRSLRNEVGLKIYELSYQFAVQEIIECNLPQVHLKPVLNVR